MKCKDGWLATESNETDVRCWFLALHLGVGTPCDVLPDRQVSQRKCECINPCYGKQCTPPYLAVIDYTRQVRRSLHFCFCQGLVRFNAADPPIRPQFENDSMDGAD